MEKSDSGWLILCEVCSSQTATVQDGGMFFCETCLGSCDLDDDDEMTTEAEDQEIICDCGAEKTGTTHATWCSTEEKQ